MGTRGPCLPFVTSHIASLKRHHPCTLSPSNTNPEYVRCMLSAVVDVAHSASALLAVPHNVEDPKTQTKQHISLTRFDCLLEVSKGNQRGWPVMTGAAPRTIAVVLHQRERVPSEGQRTWRFRGPQTQNLWVDGRSLCEIAPLKVFGTRHCVSPFRTRASESHADPPNA